MLPPISVGNPAQRKICPTRAVVVDFPLVPVIPMIRGSAKFLTKTSISPIIGVFASFAFLATTCGLGYECGIPGLRIMESLPENAIAIIGVDDPESIGIAKRLAENEYKNLRVTPISGLVVPENGVGVLNGNIVSNINCENEVVISLHDNTILPGVHNWQMLLLVLRSH